MKHRIYHDVFFEYEGSFADTQGSFSKNSRKTSDMYYHIFSFWRRGALCEYMYVFFALCLALPLWLKTSPMDPKKSPACISSFTGYPALFFEYEGSFADTQGSFLNMRALLRIRRALFWVWGLFCGCTDPCISSSTKILRKNHTKSETLVIGDPCKRVTAKEPYVLYWQKSPTSHIDKRALRFILTKEPYVSCSDIFSVLFSWLSPCNRTTLTTALLFAQELHTNCTSALYIRNPIYPQKRPIYQYIRKRALDRLFALFLALPWCSQSEYKIPCICKRTLYIHKRALYISKRALYLLRIPGLSCGCVGTCAGICRALFRIWRLFCGYEGLFF